MMNDPTISLVKGALPGDAAAEMERLYQHVFSSVQQLTSYGSLEGDISAYRECDKEGAVKALLLYRREGDSVRILNEQIPLSADDVMRCARTLFARTPEISVIRFNAIRAEFSALDLPFQKFQCSEDIVVTLPASVDAYNASLGKATRKALKNKLNRLTRDFPTMQFRVLEKDAADEQDIRAIIDFNRRRMAVKNTVSYIDEEEAQRMIARVRACGWIAVLTIDGRIRAGSICSRIGNHFFTHISSYDSEFDEYRLGTLCCYLTVCEAIKEGGSEFHFLWGRNEYKFLLLGKMRELSSVTVYRSYAHLFRHGRMALQVALDGYKRKAKFGILELSGQRNSNAPSVRLAAFAVNTLRRIKHPPGSRPSGQV